MFAASFQLKGYNAERELLRVTRKRRSRSFVQGFLKLHFHLSAGSGTNITITDVLGTGKTNGSGSNTHGYNYLCSAPGRGGAGFCNPNGSQPSTTITWSSSANNGIVVGTGSTAVAPTDFKLATQVVDGTTAGTLEHLTCAGTNLTTSATAGSFDVERLFRNSSGGSITINEIGIYCLQATDSSANQVNHFCILRDLVSPGFAVANLEYMRAIYTLTVTA